MNSLVMRNRWRNSQKELLLPTTWITSWTSLSKTSMNNLGRNLFQSDGKEEFTFNPVDTFYISIVTSHTFNPSEVNKEITIDKDQIQGSLTALSAVRQQTPSFLLTLKSLEP